jgi:ubiquinone/menaquinone biosynthesis C-methylase UbiE
MGIHMSKPNLSNQDIPRGGKAFLPHKSYDVRCEHVSIEAELNRLQCQVEISWEKERIQLASFGLHDGVSILELGSGPGFVTNKLLEMLPSSHITALEIDPMFIDLAKQYLGHAIKAGRLNIVQGTVTKLNLPANRFDIAIARFLFQHLPDPIGAAHQIFRVLKPGGKLVIIDRDDSMWGLTDPPMAEIHYVLRKLGQVQRSRGGDRYIGRQLYHLMDQAGFEDTRLDALVAHTGELDIEQFLPQFHPVRLLPLVQSGIIPARKYRELCSAYKDFLSSEDPFIMMLLLLACGTKPTK